MEPITLDQTAEVEYPDSDGQPMSDNTLQFQWIVVFQGNLDAVFENANDVFVAGDLLWYPLPKRLDIRAAPDVMVVFGRPKGYRGSYQQWLEGNIAPQVVFEIQSPGNRPEEMQAKLQFYEDHGVEEYYLYDPHNVRLSGWRRVGTALQPIPVMHDWVSPRLKIRFDTSGPELVVYRPDGTRFLTFLELNAQRREAEQRAENERRLKEEERRLKEEAERQADEERRLKEEAEHQAEDERRLKEEERRLKEEARRRADQERHLKEEAERRAEQERRLKEEERRLKEEAERRAEQESREKERERQQKEDAERRAREERRQKEEAQRAAGTERQQREQAEEQTRRLADRLRALGIDPDAPAP